MSLAPASSRPSAITPPPTERPTIRPGVFPAYPSYVDYDAASSGTRTSVYQPTTAPRTGDESRTGLWGVCTLVSGTLMLCCVQYLRRRRRDEDEAS